MKRKKYLLVVVQLSQELHKVWYVIDRNERHVDNLKRLF